MFSKSAIQLQLLIRYHLTASKHPPTLELIEI